jgi:hypothetical protein
MYKSDYLITKTFLALNNYVQERRVVPSPRRKRKGKLSKSKLNSKSKLKKKGGRAVSEARYRHRRYSSTPPTIGGTVPSGLTSFPKKAKFKIEKEVARRTMTQKK